MFKNYNIIQTYLYLEILFASLGLSLFISKYGTEPLKALIKMLLEKLDD